MQWAVARMIVISRVIEMSLLFFVIFGFGVFIVCYFGFCWWGFGCWREICSLTELTGINRGGL